MNLNCKKALYVPLKSAKLLAFSSLLWWSSEAFAHKIHRIAPNAHTIHGT